MKPLSPRSRLKGDPFLPNRFIFGDAIDQHGIEEYEYLVHTEQPSFVCRLMHRAIPFDGADAEGFASAMLFDPEENVSYYTCNDGLAMTDFVFLGEGDSEPTAGKLQKICDEAVAAYWAIDEAYKKNPPELNEYGRRPRQLDPVQLEDSARLHAVAELARAARDALDTQERTPQLIAHTHTALHAGDPRVLAEALFALNDAPAARERLIDTARALIAQPEVARPDGSFIPYELWAMPLLYNTNHAGDCWFFPRLAELELALQKTLGIPYGKGLHVSPTLFTPDMLYASGCQVLSQLASMLDAGEAYIPGDIAAMRSAYQEGKQRFVPRMTLNWIVFAVEHDALDTTLLTEPKPVLDALMQVIEAALGEYIDYAEATLFMPEPLWRSLSTGTRASNQQRLAFTSTLLDKRIGLANVHAHIELMPAQGAFQLKLQGADEQDNDTVETSFAWLMTPDIAPNREAALAELEAILQIHGIACDTYQDRLH